MQFRDIIGGKETREFKDENGETKGARPTIYQDLRTDDVCRPPFLDDVCTDRQDRKTRQQKNICDVGASKAGLGYKIDLEDQVTASGNKKYRRQIDAQIETEAVTGKKYDGRFEAEAKTKAKIDVRNKSR